MNLPRRPIFALLTLFSFLSGCSGYEYTLNDRVVYTPPPSPTIEGISDAALANCAQQALLDQGVSKPSMLKQLSCSHAGIADLGGIDQFTGLEKLNLSDNKLETIEPLRSLPHINELYLARNQLSSIAELRDFTSLVKLDVRENELLSCGEIEPLLKIFSGLELSPLDHC